MSENHTQVSTHPNTSAATSKSSSKERTSKSTTTIIDEEIAAANPNKERLVEFQERVELAAKEPGTVIEAQPHILSHYGPKDLPGGYFVYKNVIVCPEGKAAEIEQRLSLSIEDSLFPKPQKAQ